MGEKNNIKMTKKSANKDEKQKTIGHKKKPKIIKKNSQWPFWASVLCSAAGCVG